jgi:hypothetical protein
LWPCLALFCACTTITIDEREAFDAKRTVDEDFFVERGVERRVFELRPDDGVRLVGWVLDRPDDQATVLLFGGNGFLMVTAYTQLDALLELPVDVVTLDYRGYGASTGEPSVEGLKRDALAAADYVLQTLDVPPSRLVVHGHSLGSFVALFVARQREHAAVVLENPVSSTRDLVDGLVPWFLDPLVHFDVDDALTQDDNVERARSLGSPLLIFSGTEDPITPDRMARRIHEAAAGSEWVSLEGGSHNDLPSFREFSTAYRRFVGQRITTAGLHHSRE